MKLRNFCNFFFLERLKNIFYFVVHPDAVFTVFISIDARNTSEKNQSSSIDDGSLDMRV